MFKKLINLFFFGNFFAAICAVFLCIETNLQHNKPLNGAYFYLIIFLGTACYYTFLYTKNIPNQYSNERVVWYKLNSGAIAKLQLLLLVLILLFSTIFIWKYFNSFKQLSGIKIGQIVIFPLIALVYTFNLLPFPEAKKLRRIGWLKPFIIGFVWSGIVTVYPIIFYQIQVGLNSGLFFSFPSGFLLLTNFLFISALCILFDIKDTPHDKKEGIKTFSVQFGIENTIIFIVLPLIILGALFTLFFQVPTIKFTFLQKFITLIPYFLVVIVAYTLRKHRSIIYYLSIIDGLMIAKAISGIVAVLLINY